MDSDTSEDISDLAIFDRLNLSKAEAARALDVSRQTLHNRLSRNSSPLSADDWNIIARHFQTHDPKNWGKLVDLLEQFGKSEPTTLRTKVPSGVPGVTLADFSPTKISAVIPDFDLFRTVEHDCFEQLADEIARGTSVDVYVHGRDSKDDFVRSLLSWRDISEELIEECVNINFFVEPGPRPFVFQVNPKGSLQVIYLTAILNQFVEVKDERPQYASIHNAATRRPDEEPSKIAG